MASRFLLTNRVVNPVVRTLLRTPAGRRLGQHLAILRYRGRRTGRSHEVVVQYGRDGSTVWINVGQPELKTWWRNLRERRPVELWLAGRHSRAMAVAVLGETDPDAAATVLEAYRAVLGRVEANPDDLDSAVLVRADLIAGDQ